MGKQSDITKRFLLSAKHQEIQELRNLSSNCRTVKAVKDVIHQLQRERGMSNVYLASKGEQFASNRLKQITLSADYEQNLRSLLKSLYLGNHDNGQSMRLLSSITFALQGMDHLPNLRDNVAERVLPPLESTKAYCRLISGLLDVVFEAADVTSDPQMTRLLVALFNFMQGKEYAGQERAWGAIGFAENQFNSSLCDRISGLTESQNQCFETFLNFADDEEKNLWQQQQSSEATQHLERLRKMICALASGGDCAPNLSEIWYDIATQRIDAMQQIEEHLTVRLTSQASLRITQAETELRNRERLIASLNESTPVSGAPITMLYDSTVRGLRGADVDQSDFSDSTALSAHKSFYDLIRGQAKNIQDIAAELAEAKKALREQKVIDRAKLLLMQQMKSTEQQAFRALQKSAMEQNMKIIDLAQRLVSAVSK